MQLTKQQHSTIHHYTKETVHHTLVFNPWQNINLLNMCNSYPPPHPHPHFQSNTKVEGYRRWTDVEEKTVSFWQKKKKNRTRHQPSAIHPHNVCSYDTRKHKIY